MTDKKLISILNTSANQEVFFGPQGFKQVATQNELNKAQLGFGMSELGQAATSDDLSGEEKGCWQTSWQVFARDTELGDPYFVDTNQAELPVYTGFLAETGWEVELVATSLVSYIACMQLLFDHGQQTQAQFFPDPSSVIDEAILQRLQQQLIEISSCHKFWQLFMQCYLDWLIED
ncbi:hypothetical protein H4J46_16425 [Colwellia sp. MB02u-6]|uniref:hypothetical protein n=1 Tax=Colwellia sp. MB02u-6 TaxID=2759824 RepID=UPI0015F61190|nr:hypothetical protein [Colwellia sp. MB02u-6]MBA6329498.1 hypothetical protein [Colwellia sp. MB02u-6]